MSEFRKLSPFYSSLKRLMTLGFSVGILCYFGCDNSKIRFYVLDKMRVPVAQLLVTGKADSQPGCSAFDGIGVLCQQYPLRPSTKAWISFVVISPAGSEKPSINLTSLTAVETSFSSRLASGNSVSVENSSLPWTELGRADGTTIFEPLSQPIQSTPIRIDRISFAISLPSAENLINRGQQQGIPTYVVRYEASSNLYKDSGLVSFQVVPEPESEIWNALKQGQIPGTAEAFLERLRKDSKSNIPPKIQSILPVANSTQPKSFDIETQVSEQDSDPLARKRVQWFVSRGELQNEHSAVSNWKDTAGGPLGAFVVVRDLQGGMDFSYSTFNIE